MIMKRYQIAAVALVFAILGGCADMGGVVGTSAVQADGAYGPYLPVEPKSPWFAD